MTPKVGATLPPTNPSHPSAEPLDFNATTNARSGQTQRIYGLVHFTDIVWPMNLWCGPGMSMSQTPPYLDIQEFMHLVFQAPHTLAPKDLLHTPLANQQYPCQGTKVNFIVHFFMYWSSLINILRENFVL